MKEKKCWLCRHNKKTWEPRTQFMNSYECALNWEHYYAPTVLTIDCEFGMRNLDGACDSYVPYQAPKSCKKCGVRTDEWVRHRKQVYCRDCFVGDDRRDLQENFNRASPLSSFEEI
jgi:hypothetical protein